MTAKINVIYYVMLLLVLILFGACSPRRNTTATRAYHELTTRYNIYYNAEKAYNEICENQAVSFSDNYSELLPFYPLTPLKEKTLPGGPFDAVVDKTSKAIREHSITAKPRRDPTQRQTEAYRQWLRQEEFNPFLKNAWLLLGKAHLQNRDYAQALAVFNHMQRIYKNDSDLISEVQLWMMRAYTEMERMYDAENMVYILRSNILPKPLNKLFEETYTHYLFQKRAYNEAIPWLMKVIAQEDHFRQKKRLQFLLGQTYAIVGEKEKAFRAFEAVKGLSTPFELTLHATISQLAVAPEVAQPGIRRSLTKMREKVQNENELEKIQAVLGLKHSVVTDSASHLVDGKIQSLSDPMKDDSIRMVAQMHESLYQKAYRAWQEGDTTAVRSAWESFHVQYPRSGLLPQFLLLHALSYAQSGNAAETERYLNELLDKFPESAPAPLAQSIADGLAQGRNLAENTAIGSEWSGNVIHSIHATAGTKEKAAFSTNKSGPHMLLLLFERESPDKNKILFSTANFNFSRFRLRTFGLSFITIHDREALIVQPFHSYDEASRYTLMMQSDSLFTRQMPEDVTPLIISGENLSILQEHGIMDEYRLFSIENFGDKPVTIQSAVNTPVEDRGENILQKSENILSLKAKKRPDTVKSGEAAAPLPVEEKRHHTSTKTHVVPLTGERRITPEELQRRLEQKAAAALQQNEERSSGRSRESLLKERARERQEKIRQRERELEERARRREAELQQREKERAKKIREQEQRKREKQRERERTRTQ